MDEIKDLIPLLHFLLPGFLAAWIFYGLTPFEKPSPFERIIHAMVLTIIVQVLVICSKWLFELIGSSGYSFGPWVEDSRTVWSVIYGAAIGLAFSYAANGNKVHERLIALGITKETSYSSVWAGAFTEADRYVILHLNVEDRRIYGWPREWPGSASDGHFLLKGACWLTEDAVIPLDTAEGILIPASQVTYVEFVK